jgi:hypothetical protein
VAEFARQSDPIPDGPHTVSERPPPPRGSTEIERRGDGRRKRADLSADMRRCLYPAYAIDLADKG